MAGNGILVSGNGILVSTRRELVGFFAEVSPLEVCRLQPLSAGGEVSHLKPQKQNGGKTAAQLSWGYRFN